MSQTVLEFPRPFLVGRLGALVGKVLTATPGREVLHRVCLETVEVVAAGRVEPCGDTQKRKKKEKKRDSASYTEEKKTQRSVTHTHTHLSLIHI